MIFRSHAVRRSAPTSHCREAGRQAIRRFRRGIKKRRGAGADASGGEGIVVEAKSLHDEVHWLTPTGSSVRGAGRDFAEAEDLLAHHLFSLLQEDADPHAPANRHDSAVVTQRGKAVLNRCGRRGLVQSPASASRRQNSWTTRSSSLCPRCARERTLQSRGSPPRRPLRCSIRRKGFRRADRARPLPLSGE